MRKKGYVNGTVSWNLTLCFSPVVYLYLRAGFSAQGNGSERLDIKGRDWTFYSFVGIDISDWGRYRGFSVALLSK